MSTNNTFSKVDESWLKVFSESEIKCLLRKMDNKRQNAHDRHLAFTLSRNEWLMLGHKLLGRGNCDYTNLPLITQDFKDNRPPNPFYPTVERIDDSKGYISGNVCVVGYRANQLKDKLVDKCTNIVIDNQKDQKIVRALILNMSSDHLNRLKERYIYQPNKEVSKDCDKECKLNTKEDSIMPELSVVENVVETRLTESNISSADTLDEKGDEGQSEISPLPRDVVIAQSYMNHCKAFSSVGMKVDVSFAQYKRKFVRKTCAMSGEELSDNEKYVLIMDLDSGFSAGNFVIVSQKMQTAMSNLIAQTKLPLPDVYAMMKNICEKK